MQAKRQRIQSIAGLGGVTDDALRKLVQKIKDEPELLDDLSSRQSIGDATLAIFDSLGQTDELTRDFTWHHVSPQKLLQHLISESRSFAETVLRKMQTCPNTHANPWHIVLYVDEITPGNVLRPDNRRKLHAFYYSFKELGREILCHAEAWLPVAVLRNVICKEVSGKLSAAMRILLRRFFVGPQAFHNAGVVLNLPGAPTVFFAQLGNILGDESALKSIWSSKGAAGLLPCILCKNICTHGLQAHDASGYLQDLSCREVASLDLASDADIWAKADALAAAAGVVSRSEFEKLERASGLSHSSSGVLLDAELRFHVRPASVHTYDSMHTAFSNGLAHFEIHLFFGKASTEKINFRALETYLKAAWNWPNDKQQKGKSLHQIFNAAREASSSDHFKCSASEVLMLFPIMQHFVLTVVAPTGKPSKEIESFTSCCIVLRELQAIKKGMGSVETLQQAIRNHMANFLDAYGLDCFKPKHHFAMHLPAQIQRDGLVLDCFVLERKHQMIKACCNWVDNTCSFEKSAIARAVLEQTRLLQQPGWTQSGLKGPSKDCPHLALERGCRNAFVARRMQSNGILFATGDVVQLHNELLLVESCACLDTKLCIVVSSLRCVQQLTAYSWRCKPNGNLQLVDCSVHAPQQAACWSFEADGHILVLV